MMRRAKNALARHPSPVTRHAAKGLCILPNISIRPEFRRTHQECVAEFGIETDKIVAADDASLRELIEDRLYGFIKLEHGLVEARTVERELYARHCAESRNELVGLGL